MAKNYTMTEVANIFAEKSDFEAMADIGKRYPLLAIKMTALATKAPEETADIFSYMPDYLSANKVNKAIKDGGEDVSDSDVEDDETTEAPAEKPAKKPVAKKEAKADTGSKDFDSMNSKQMYELLGELGERKACKAEFGDLSKASMTAYLKKHHSDGAAEAEDEAEEEAEVGKYDGKKAPELYAICKKRGIKAEPKKPAKYYIDLLEKADAAEAEEEPEDEDDWGEDAEAEESADDADDDEDEWKEPEEKPKKKAGRPKKAAAKPVAKKAAKKAEEPDDDDDDDWDI